MGAAANHNTKMKLVTTMFGANMCSPRQIYFTASFSKAFQPSTFPKNSCTGIWDSRP
ncbi:Uncharacterised protein [Serratia fonticola]|uniref:Uncharacterized protein n=1 Tax=Serratia fonticola TaxID=47917 RepID=A0A4U9V6E9_SERFO|nr:Uncharacterised protein [Serratia fonticola]